MYITDNVIRIILQIDIGAVVRVNKNLVFSCLYKDSVLIHADMNIIIVIELSWFTSLIALISLISLVNCHKVLI